MQASNKESSLKAAKQHLTALRKNLTTDPEWHAENVKKMVGAGLVTWDEIGSNPQELDDLLSTY